MAAAVMQQPALGRRKGLGFRVYGLGLGFRGARGLRWVWGISTPVKRHEGF